jgi:putative oxidoreductase
VNLRALLTGPQCADSRAGWGLFVLRVSVGGFMLFGHGLKKLMAFGELSSRFSDPLGVGSQASLSLAVFAEVFCAAALILGLATRWAAIPLIVTMLVAAFLVHTADPWAKKEFALLYLIPFLTLLIAGPGRAALDNVLRKE